jgi:hypothetical protein
MGLQNQVDYENKGGEVESQVGGLRFSTNYGHRFLGNIHSYYHMGHHANCGDPNITKQLNRQTT